MFVARCVSYDKLKKEKKKSCGSHSHFRPLKKKRRGGRFWLSVAREHKSACHCKGSLLNCGRPPKQDGKLFRVRSFVQSVFVRAKLGYVIRMDIYVFFSTVSKVFRVT